MMNKRSETINALDIWNAPTLKESKKRLRELNKEIANIKAWHGWCKSVIDLKAQIANGEEVLSPAAPHIRLEDLLLEAEMNRNEWEAKYRDGIKR